MKHLLITLSIVLSTCLYSNLIAQTASLKWDFTTTQVQTKYIIKVEDFDKINDIHKLQLKPRKSISHYKIFGDIQDLVTKVEVKVLHDDNFEYMANLPHVILTPYNTQIIFTDSIKNRLDSNDLENFIPIDMTSTFNYDENTFLQALDQLEYPYIVFEDGTISFDIDSITNDINLNDLTFVDQSFTEQGIYLRTTTKYKKANNSKILEVYKLIENLEKMNEEVTVLNHLEFYTEYPSLGITNSNNRLKNNNSLSGSNGLADKGGVKKMSKKKELTALLEGDCKTSPIIKVSNMLGQNIPFTLIDNQLDKSKLPNGLYKVCKLCNNKHVFETIVINSNN